MQNLCYLPYMNYRVYLRFFVTLLSCYISSDVYAQRFPVQATIQVLPPYSPYLSDYVAPGQDRIRITLVLLDQKEPSLPVKLKLHIEGEGYTFASGTKVATLPLTLQANVPLTLTNADLLPYLRPDNALVQNFKTNSNNPYKLNEGLYQFCVEVYHYIRDETPISDMACTLAFLQELDPPLIVSPEGEVTPGAPQAMMISWHTQHFGGFPVDYEVSVYEQVAGMGDQAIVEYTAPLLRQTTPGLAYMYRADDPPLEIGRTYLVRVRVRDALGRNLFKNDGYSTIQSFQYGRPCEVPAITEARLYPDGHAHIAWTTASNYGAEEIRYRYKDELSWTRGTTTDQSYAIPIKKSRGPLEVQIGTTCYQSLAVESEIAKIKLDRKSLPRGFYSCGMEPGEEAAPTNVPLEELNANDTISSNGYMVIISSATKNGDGSYSGTGGIAIPMFNGVVVKGSFSHIRVNEDYVMTAGEIKLESAGVLLLSDKYLALLDGLIETMQSASNILNTVTFQSAIEYLRPYLGLFLDDALKDALQQAIDDLENATDPDALLKAQEHLISVLGEITAEIKILYDAPYQIKFVADPDQRYGFDSYDKAQFAPLRSDYDQLSIGQHEYDVPYKSLAVGERDYLIAKPDVLPTPESEEIYFVTEEGTRVESIVQSDGSYRLHLPASTAKHLYILYAVIAPIDSTLPEHIAGQCKIIVYEPQVQKVVLIPVAGAQAPDAAAIQTALNKIYSPAVTQWKVSLAPNITVPGYDGVLDSIKTGILSTYTTEMRSIIQAYDQGRDDTTAYHLFIVSSTAETGLLGFMPKKRAYGFIVSTDATTIAHELGHGAFRLSHIWEDYPGVNGSGDLMDYSQPQGSQLLHYQWELVQKPEPMVGWMQGDDEGKQIVQQAFYYDRYVYFRYDGGESCYGAITPGGQKISLPANAIASFYPSDGGAWPKGSLAGFNIDKTTYLGWWNPANNYFYGYAPVRQTPGGNEPILPYYTGLAGSSQCTIFSASGLDADCNQTILFDSLHSLTLANIGVDSIVVSKKLSLQNLSIYESGKGVQGPCGCYSGACVELLEKFKDHPYLKEKSLLRDVICRNPCLLNQPFITFDNLPTASGQWMEDFNTVFGSLLQIGFAPALVDAAGAYFLAELPALLQQKGKDFVIGYVFDLLVQRAMHDVFNADEPLQLDFAQALSSGFESMIELKNAAGEIAVSVALECFVNGNFSEGKIRDHFDVDACSTSALWAVLIQGGIKGIGAGIRTIPKDKFIEGLARLIRSPDSPEALFKAGLSPDDGTLWKLYKLFHGDIPNATDIEALFKTSKIEAGDDWIKHFEDASVKADLLESGFYLKFRDLPFTEEEKKEMLKSLLEYGKEHPGDLKKVLEDFDGSGDKLEFVRGLKAIEGSWKIFLEDAFVQRIRNEVLANIELRNKFPTLSVEELTAIKVYTSNQMRNGEYIYKSLNTELRDGTLSDFSRELNDLLNKGLSKLVPYNGLRVFRGCGELESQIAKKWNVGDFIKFDDFKSSSIYENTAINFMNLGSGDVIYEILNPKGYNICQISCLPGEAEILFKSGSKFKILKTEGLFINIEKGSKKIQLEFIP
ncbi:MAG: hypothetical protein IPJ09_14540 [Saprospiraceae bacterium]|nr:hypothetical protein [Saprospiraceae bacterium]